MTENSAREQQIAGLAKKIAHMIIDEFENNGALDAEGMANCFMAIERVTAAMIDTMIPPNGHDDAIDLLAKHMRGVLRSKHQSQH